MFSVSSYLASIPCCTGHQQPWPRVAVGLRHHRASLFLLALLLRLWRRAHRRHVHCFPSGRDGLRDAPDGRCAHDGTAVEPHGLPQ